MLNTKVTIHTSDASILDILNELSGNENIRFTYINNDIPLQNKVSLAIVDQPLRFVLDSLFNNTDVVYFLVARQILLKKQEKIKSDTIAPSSDTISISSDTSYAKLPDTISVKREISSQKNIPSNEQYHFALFGEKYKRDSLTISDSLSSDTIRINSVSQISSKVTKQEPSYKTKEGRISISAFGAIGMSYRKLNSGTDSLIARRNKDEKWQNSFATGAYISYSLNSRIILRSGISYISVGEKGTHTDTVPAINPRPGFPLPPGSPHSTNTISFTYSNRYNYIAIPLMIGYKAGNKLYASVYSGIEAGVFLNYSTTYPNNTDSTFKNGAFPGTKSPLPYHKLDDPKQYSYKNICFLLPIVFEAGYKFENGFGVFISSSFTYFLSNIYTSTDSISEHPYYWNVAGGISYTFSQRKIH